MMSPFQSTYYPKVYRDFKEIEVTNYRRIIHFYEKHEDEIMQLDLGEYFELVEAYTNALFEVGYHQKHLLMIDTALELVIEYNIRHAQGEDIFQKCLFRKASSLYNLREYSQSKYILKELIRIEPYHEDAIMFLKKCARKDEPDILNHAKAVSIFLLLLTALIISVEVLFVRPFYDIYTNLIETSRITTFLIACLILVLGTIWHYLKVENQINEFVIAIRKKKSDRNKVNVI
jgi:tetratricopeptide (TPR) repeat protein